MGKNATCIWVLSHVAASVFPTEPCAYSCLFSGIFVRFPGTVLFMYFRILKKTRMTGKHSLGKDKWQPLNLGKSSYVEDVAQHWTERACLFVSCRDSYCCPGSFSTSLEDCHSGVTCWVGSSAREHSGHWVTLFSEPVTVRTSMLGYGPIFLWSQRLFWTFGFNHSP